MPPSTQEKEIEQYRLGDERLPVNAKADAWVKLTIGALVDMCIGLFGVFGQ